MDETIATSASDSTDVAAPSMADTIRETLSNINARGDESAEPAAEPQEQTEAAKQGRDDRGRFAPKSEPEGEPISEVADAAKQGPTDDAPAVAEQRLPRWSKQALEAWRGLPDGEAKDAILRAGLARDDAFFAGIENYKTPAERWTKFEQSVGPETINYLRAKANGDEAAGLRGLVQLEQWANSQPQQFIQWFARNAGINLGEGWQPVQEQAQPRQDPAVAELQRQIQSMQQAEQQRQQQAMTADLDRFIAEHDKAGYLNDWIDAPGGAQPGPFVQRFLWFMQSGAAKNYADAYAMAKAATPEIQQAEVARLRAEAIEAERKAQATRDAKRAASVNVQSRGSLPPTHPVGTMEDTIRETYRRLTS